MPKRRRSDVGIAVGGARGSGASGGVQGISAAEEDVVSDAVVQEMQWEQPTPIIPVFRDGMEQRLDTPLSRESGETSRRRQLWDNFTSDRNSLSPEELGELYEYAHRRVNFAFRRYRQNPSFENSMTLVDRATELRMIEDRIVPESRIETSQEVRDALSEVVATLTTRSARGISEESLTWNSERERLFNTLREMADRGSEEARRDLLRLAWAKAESSRRAAIGVMSGEVDPARLAPAYGEYCDALDASRPYLSDEQRAFFQAWKNRWAESVRYAQRRGGSVNVSDGPNGLAPSGAGDVRLPEPPEAPGTSSVALLVPSNVASQRLRQHAAELGLRVASSPDELPDGIRTVVNWGVADTSVFADRLRARGIRLVNADVNSISNKASALSLLGDLAPRTTRDPEQARQLFGNMVVAKRSLRSARGGSKEVLDFGGEMASERSLRYDLFQEFIPERDEWRVNVFGDRVLTAYSKNVVSGTPATDLSPRRNYYRLSSLPNDVVQIALEARRRAGVEFAGVDVIRDRRTGRYYVLELNAAPGMSRETLLRLVEEIGNREESS